MSSFSLLRRPQMLAAAPVQARTTVAIVAVVVALVVGTVPWRLSQPWWVGAGLVVVLLVTSVAAAVDVTSGRIPDAVVLASLVPTAFVVGVRLGSDGPAAAVPHVLFGAVAFALPLLVAHLAAPDALGFGDVKLAASLGAALGLVDWPSSVTALCVASGLTATVAVVRRCSTMPFAPGLVAGSALALLISEGSSTWR